MWLDCRALGLDNDALRRFMIEQAGLGLNDGCSFGRSLNGYMRLNAACPRSVLEQAIEAARSGGQGPLSPHRTGKGGKSLWQICKRRASRQQYGNLILTLAACLIGALIGVVAPNFGTTIKPIGDIFLNLLFTISGPPGVRVHASAVGSMANMKRLGKILGGTIGTFIFTGAIAGVCVLVWVNLFSPSAGTTIELVASEVGEAQTAGELLVSSLTVSDFSDLWDKSNMLPLIIFAILFGFCVSACGGEQSPMGELLANLNDIIMKFVGIIMLVAPIGLGAYFATWWPPTAPESSATTAAPCAGLLPPVRPSRVIFVPLYAFLAGGRRGVAAMVKNILRPAVTAFATHCLPPPPSP